MAPPHDHTRSLRRLLTSREVPIDERLTYMAATCFGISFAAIGGAALQLGLGWLETMDNEDSVLFSTAGCAFGAARSLIQPDAYYLLYRFGAKTI